MFSILVEFSNWSLEIRSRDWKKHQKKGVGIQNKWYIIESFDDMLLRFVVYIKSTSSKKPNLKCLGGIGNTWSRINFDNSEVIADRVGQRLFSLCKHLSGRGGGTGCVWLCKPPTKFPKEGDLAGSQFLKEGCWNRGEWSFSVGCSFS